MLKFDWLLVWVLNHLDPKVCFLDPMLSGNKKHLHNTSVLSRCTILQGIVSLRLQWTEQLYALLQ